MKKLTILVFFMIFSVFLTGCQTLSNYDADFKIYDYEMEREINYSIDKTNNVIFVPKPTDSDYTLKITPPNDLVDFSEVKIWCNDILFQNNNLFYSNGKDIFISLPKDNRTFAKISIQWNFKSRVQDYFITYR